MKPQSATGIQRISATTSVTLLLVVQLLVTSCTGQAPQARTEEMVFHSESFKVVGDLKLPDGRGPHPVVVFVHGDGPNDRTANGTYLPIMERMAKAGYATFAWDKPGTGESTGEIDRSRLGQQRAQMILDAIKVLKAHPDIDHRRIGLWGISQAGYVMPRVLSMSKDIAFMIAVSCAGMPGVDQGAFLVSAQAVCAGIPVEEAQEMKRLLSEAERVQTYDEYVQYKESLDALPGIGFASIFGYKTGVVPEQEWHVPNLQGEYFWNPMEVIEHTTIPVLAFFGERDTQIDPIQGAQAYGEALERAGNSSFRVELIPGTDHNIILSETGCLDERERRPRSEWTNYAPEYLDTLEEWLRELNRQSPAGRAQIRPVATYAGGLPGAGFPVAVLERSPLVLRDLDLLKDIDERARASVMWSIIYSPDSKYRVILRQLERLAPPPQKRFAAMEQFARAGMLTGTCMMPILPDLCDTDENLDAVVRWTAEHGGRFVLAGGLTLADQQRDYFLGVLAERFPDLVEHYQPAIGDTLNLSAQTLLAVLISPSAGILFYLFLRAGLGEEPGLRSHPARP